MARRRLFLIPPSEGKVPGGAGPPRHESIGSSVRTGDCDSLGSSRRVVIDALQTRLAGAQDVASSEADLARFFGVKGDALSRALEVDSVVSETPTLPAIDRYNGVLYQYLDVPSLTTAQRRRLERSALILSGMWGVLRPDEPVPDYRLKMSASLEPLGKLSTWWRPRLMPVLAEAAKGTELWNLLPQEHTAAVGTIDELGLRGCTTASFLSPNRSGQLTAVNHWNKALKGALVGHLIRHPSTTLDDLVSWEDPVGYRLDPESIDPVDDVRQLRFVSRG